MSFFRRGKFLMRILAFPLYPRYIRCSTVITPDIIEFDWWFETTHLSPKSAAVIKVISDDWAGVILVWPFLVKLSIFTQTSMLSHPRHLCFWHCYMHTSPIVRSLMCGGLVSTQPMSYCTTHILNSTNPWIRLLNEFIYNWKSSISLSAKLCAVLVAPRYLTQLVIFLSTHISSSRMYVWSMYQASKMAQRLVWFELCCVEILVWCEMCCVELPLWHIS